MSLLNMSTGVKQDPVCPSVNNIIDKRVNQVSWNFQDSFLM